MERLGMEWIISELKKGDRDLYRLFASVIYNKNKEDITDFERTLAKLRLLDAGTRPVTELEEILVGRFRGNRLVIEDR